MKNLFYFFMFMIIIIGCGQDKSEESYAVEKMAAAPSEEMYDLNVAVEENTTDQVVSPVAQKIIKTGNFTFETASVQQTFLSIKQSVEKNKGFVQNDETQKQYDRISRTLVIRIPTKEFQPLVDSISKDVKVFDEQKIELQDVTEEFVDLESRMKAKKELENRYIQILNKANSIKDILEIEAQLSKIREEIEAQEGRLKYLQNKVSLSTLHITFYEMVSVKNAPSQSYFPRLWNAFKSGFYGIGEFIIGIFTLWPLIIIGGLAAYFIRKRIKNKNNDSTVKK